MVRTTHINKTEKVGITLPNSLIKQTDRLRDDIPRGTYIRRAIENYLKQSKVRRPLRESRHLEGPVVSAGSHNETTRPLIVKGMNMSVCTRSLYDILRGLVNPHMVLNCFTCPPSVPIFLI